MAPVAAPLPTAVLNFSPCNSLSTILNKPNATAPPAPAPVIPAAAIRAE